MNDYDINISIISVFSLHDKSEKLFIVGIEENSSLSALACIPRFTSWRCYVRWAKHLEKCCQIYFTPFRIYAKRWKRILIVAFYMEKYPLNLHQCRAGTVILLKRWSTLHSLFPSFQHKIQGKSQLDWNSHAWLCAFSSSLIYPSWMFFTLNCSLCLWSGTEWFNLLKHFQTFFHNFLILNARRWMDGCREKFLTMM